MALADTIRSSVTTARTILDTGRLLTTVYQHPWDSMNAYGEPTFATRIARKALVSPVMVEPGQAERAKIKLTFLEDFVIDTRDFFEYPWPDRNHWETSGIVNLHRGVLENNRQAFVMDVYL